jgi:hypothetical protein
MAIWIWLAGALVFGSGSTYCFRTARHAWGLCFALAVIACVMMAGALTVVAR